ncbi:MAG: type IV secretion system protein [bacterium]|jgi:type IV secretion system protein VirB8|uniref:virB8 family protein n=1 Tax=unclassified Polynucleobacter TaxID=2640945 RepID=UPI001C0C2C3C|nr:MULTISPECIES: type IV secretion system protein [unclassified Polynucleobacter]MBU3587428.1 type IV secretion system protein [Polynucleobacter sp. 31A-FELB]MBU3602314.1 type IV secretion system protein [Polynucleobacter sp. AM-25C3]
MASKKPLDGEFYDAAAHWETSRQEMLEKSEGRAWIIARVAVVITLLCLIGLLIMLPFYKVIPLVFQVDKTTGETQLIDATGSSTVQTNELIDKHYIADYVSSRERYVWTLLQHDHDHVMNLSDERTGRMYDAQFEGINAKDKRLGSDTDQRITRLTVSLPPGEPGKAVVRFDRVTRQGGVDKPPEKLIATLSYAYKPLANNVQTGFAIDNPLGFTVNGYVVDAELTGVGPKVTP